MSSTASTFCEVREGPVLLMTRASLGRTVERWDRLDPSLTSLTDLAVTAQVGGSS